VEGEVESLRVFQHYCEMTLRRPLHKREIASVVGSLTFTVEFMSGREFGLRVRGEGLALLNRTRDVLQALAVSTKAAA